jgi:hypothetical protein
VTDDPVVLDFGDDDEPTLLATQEVMDQFLEDPEEAAEIIAQVKAFLAQL